MSDIHNDQATKLRFFMDLFFEYMQAGKPYLEKWQPKKSCRNNMLS